MMLNTLRSTFLFPPRYKEPILVTASLAGLFVLQGGSGTTAPTASICVVLFTWLLIRPFAVDKSTLWAVGGAAALLAGFTWGAYSAVLLGSVLLGAVHIWNVPQSLRQSAALALIPLWIGILIASKLSGWAWLGIAYIALRLLSLVVEFHAGRLLPLRLSETIIYVLFPPTLIAGPIDQPNRFAKDLRKGIPLTHERWLVGLSRVGLGAFKKFVLADTLRLVALSEKIAPDLQTPLGVWISVYLYAWVLLWDFSGYTDMAIGVGNWLGIDLPENFNRPYWQPNLSLFWQNWHMSLTGWFRTYVFLPLSRFLLRRNLPIPEFIIGQAVTMLLIGAWHGWTVNFLVWGLWHAVGLSLHRIWTRHTRPWMHRLQQHKWLRSAVSGTGMLLTFHYVVIGWVFFALPTPTLAWQTLSLMVGQ